MAIHQSPWSDLGLTFNPIEEKHMIVHPDYFRILDDARRTDLRREVRQAQWAAAKYADWIHRLISNVAELAAASRKQPASTRNSAPIGP
jgi:hypothetical protein